MSSYLIIEDDRQMCRKLAGGLRKLGHQVETAGDGLTGLAGIEKKADGGVFHNGIILDLDLPDIDSWKILQFLKTAHPNLPVVVLAEIGNKEKVDKAGKMAGVAVAVAPTDAAGILELFKSVKPAVSGKEEKKIEVEPAGKEHQEGYALVKINQRERFLPVFREIYSIEGASYCNATRGAYDIIVRLEGKRREVLDSAVAKIRKIEGVGEVDFAPIGKPRLSSDISRVVSRLDRFFKVKGCQCIPDQEEECQCGSYALLEVQKDHFEEVFRRVYFWDNVISCDTLDGPFQLSLLLKSATQDKLEDLVNDKISPMNGVLRAIECPIVKMEE